MDDKQFDKIFNEKLEELNISYDEQAYQDFLARQGNAGPSAYSGLGKWIATGALVLFSAATLYLFLQNNQLKSRIDKLTAPYASTISLVNSTTTDTLLIVDTMVINNYQYRTMNAAMVSQWLQNDKNAMMVEEYFNNNIPIAKGGDFKADQLLASNAVNEIGSIAPDWWNRSWAPGGNIPAYQKTGKIIPRKKYDPLQINIGASAGVNIPYADQGATFLSNPLQLYMELFKDEQHRLYTGLAFANLNYLLEGTSDPDKYSDEELQDFPELDEEAFLPRRVTVNNRLWSIPINYRYYDYLTNQWGLYLGGGLQLNMLSRQSFYYDYLDIKEGQLVEFDKKVVEEGTQLSIGYLNATFGIIYQIDDRMNINADVNYLHNLSPLGIEKRRIHQLGFQAGLQYRLRR